MENIDHTKEFYIKAKLPPLYWSDRKLTIESTKHDVINRRSVLREYKRYIGSNIMNGCNLYLWSEWPGVGKTTYACSLITRLIDRVKTEDPEKTTVPAMFLSVPQYLATLKDNITSHHHDEELADIYSMAKKVPLVVFDDIGTKKFSEFDMETLYAIIDYRTTNNLACVYTSNINPRYANEQFGRRLADRIISLSQSLEMPTSDTKNSEPPKTFRRPENIYQPKN